MPSDHYVLDANGEPKAATLFEWAEWAEKTARCGTIDKGGRHVAETTVGSRIWVSTVFLGLDHRYGDGPALLWETLSFWHGHFLKPEPIELTYPDGRIERLHMKKQRPFVEIPDDMERYASIEAARKGHARHVNVAKRILQELDAKYCAGYGSKHWATQMRRRGARLVNA